MKLLIAVEFSEDDWKLPEQALKLLGSAPHEVFLLHVAEPEPEFVGYQPDPAVMRDQVAESFHREHRRLQDMANGLRELGVGATALLIQGDTVATVIGQADKLEADMIVIGSRPHSASHRFFLGDACLGILKESNRPVLAIPLDRSPTGEPGGPVTRG